MLTSTKTGKSTKEYPKKCFRGQILPTFPRPTTNAEWPVSFKPGQPGQENPYTRRWAPSQATGRWRSARPVLP